MRLPQIALIVVLAAAALQLAYYYPQLPPVVASHFNASGAPNAWQSKALFVGLFCFIYALFATLYFALPHLLISMPATLVNIPNRTYWLAPQRREHTAQLVGDRMAWFGAVQIAFIAFMGQLAINANLSGAGGRLGSAVVWVGIGFAVFLIVWMIQFFRLFRQPSG